MSRTHAALAVFWWVLLLSASVGAEVSAPDFPQLPRFSWSDYYESYRSPHDQGLRGYGAPAGPGPDFRVPIRRKIFPYSAIGKIENRNSVCTGVLVGNDVVATNAHCVVEVDGSDLFPITFKSHYHRGKWWLESEAHEYSQGKRTELRNTKRDWALLRLRSPIGKILGYFGGHALDIETLTQPAWQKKLMLVGYPSDFDSAEAMIASLDCSVTSLHEHKGFEHDCRGQPGSSGSPLFYYRQGHYFLVGLHAMLSWLDEDWNWAAPYGQFRDALMYMREMEPYPYTAFNFCNTGCSLPVYMSYGYYKDNTWITKGHYKVESGTCEEFTVPVKYYDREIYWYAKNKYHWFGGRQGEPNAAYLAYQSGPGFMIPNAHRTRNYERRWYSKYSARYGEPNYIWLRNLDR